MSLSKAELDARFREKLAAREEGRVPVLVSAASSGNGASQDELNARFREKLKKHGQPAEKPAPEPKSEAEAKGKDQKKGG